MTRRRQHVPWKAAGTASESEHSADDVVRETGWVFNNVTGSELNLAEFVATGDNETGFLDPLHQIVSRNATPAERLLRLYKTEWQGDLSRIYEESF